MTVQNISNLIPTMMAVSLVNENVKNLKKPKLVKMGVKNIVGLSLIGATAKVGSL